MQQKMQQKVSVLYAGSYRPDCYGELLAYELAFNESVRLVLVLPPLTEEESPLVAKLNEAAEQVCALLAQAWDYRQCQPQLLESLAAAEVLAEKVQAWLGFAAEGGYLSAEDGQIHGDLYGDVLKEIRELVRVSSIIVQLAA